MVNLERYNRIKAYCDKHGVTLVAVSKMKTEADILALYHLGQRDFGENYVQELMAKQESLPADINWHFIGHLQSNKVKYIAPFVRLIQSVDSLKLLKEINKQAKKNDRVIDCLLQMHIAREETKFGLDEEELKTLLADVDDLRNIKIRGLMGMASFTDDVSIVKAELSGLKVIYDRYAGKDTRNCNFTTLSMGMSGDYEIAAQLGSNMVRIGSLLFGARK